MVLSASCRRLCSVESVSSEWSIQYTLCRRSSRSVATRPPKLDVAQCALRALTLAARPAARPHLAARA
eukprot:3156892-Prymnesium_polylepis.1